MIKKVISYVLKESIAFLLFIPGILYLKVRFSKQPVLFVLNYHNFSLYNNYHINRGNMLETGFSLNFEKQIKFLKKHFRFNYPEEFFNKNVNPGIHLLLTFDDGYKDNFDMAVPILRKYKIPTIFFVATKYLNGKSIIFHDVIKFLVQEGFIKNHYLKISKELYLGVNNYSNEDVKNFNNIFNKNYPMYRLMMNENEIKEIHENGFKIGNHTFEHDRLTFLNKRDQYQSIKIANDYLKNLLGVETKHIAYPNGLYNESTLNCLDELNIKFGYIVIGGYNLQSDELQTLKRIGMNASDSIYILLLKLLVYSTFKFGKI